ARAHLVLGSSTLSPQEMTDFLGQSPTITWRMGERIGHSQVRRPNNGWMLSVETEGDSVDVGCVVNTLFANVKGRESRLQELLSSYAVTGIVQLELYSHGAGWPSFYLDPIAIRAMAEIGLGLDLDVHLWR